MTKSEAKAIERRAKRAYHILNGTGDKFTVGPDEPQVPIGWISQQTPEVQKALATVRDELWAILEMASAELGGK